MTRPNLFTRSHYTAVAAFLAKRHVPKCTLPQATTLTQDVLMFERLFRYYSPRFNAPKFHESVHNEVKMAYQAHIQAQRDQDPTRPS